MRAFSYAWSLPSSDHVKKDGGDIIRSVVVENPMIHANLMALYVIKPELWLSKFYIAGIGILDFFGCCDLDLDPMIFIYELDPYCRGVCEYELPIRQGFRKLSSNRHTNRQRSYTWSLPVTAKDGGHTI